LFELMGDQRPDIRTLASDRLRRQPDPLLERPKPPY
jgi:hypothetical protein